MNCYFVVCSYILLKKTYSLKRDTEDVDELFITFRCYVSIKVFLCIYSESVMFF